MSPTPGTASNSPQGWLRDLAPTEYGSPGRVHHRVELARLLPASSSSALHHVPSITERRWATMASADFCPITTRVTTRRAAWIAVGSGGQSTPFEMGLSPAPVAITETVGFGGTSRPFERGLSPTPIASQTACGADLPG